MSMFQSVREALFRSRPRNEESERPSKRPAFILSVSDDPIRVVLHEGRRLWVGRDVCDALEIPRVRLAAGQDEIGEGHKWMCPVPTVSGTQNAVCVDEYAILLLALTSRTPQAVELRRWVAENMLMSNCELGGQVVADDGWPPSKN